MINFTTLKHQISDLPIPDRRSLWPEKLQKFAKISDSVGHSLINTEQEKFLSFGLIVERFLNGLGLEVAIVYLHYTRVSKFHQISSRLRADASNGFEKFGSISQKIFVKLS